LKCEYRNAPPKEKAEREWIGLCWLWIGKKWRDDVHTEMDFWVLQSAGSFSTRCRFVREVS
jgi:hypothetical protein